MSERDAASSERFVRGLVAITALALALRFIYVLGPHRDTGVWGDPFVYHYGANFLVKGKGFIAPMQYIFGHRSVQSAAHPPLYILFLSIPSTFGIGTLLVHKLWSALLGTATVVLAGLLGRRVAGPRVGLIAALLAAVYPNIWVYDALVLSETLAIFCATLALLLAYRAIDQPTTGRVCALGAACGAAALARSELVLLIPALLLPVALKRQCDAGTRARRAVAGIVVAVAVMAPWVTYNMRRFQHPVYLSSQLEATLAGANCDDTYHGPSTGFISSTCLYGIDQFADESVTSDILRSRARTFISDHKSRVPAVVAARVGRVLGLYRPAEQIKIDQSYEGWDGPVAWAGLFSGYAVEIAAIAGFVVLRRRRSTVYPLVVLPAVALFTVATTYGTNRFRADAETAIVVLAAVALDAAWRALRGRHDPAAPAGGEGLRTAVPG